MSALTYYAIGDVHGEADKLARLLDYIRQDALAYGHAHRIVFLGDMIDRGPDSRTVIALAKAAVEAGEAVALKGNHEELMLYAYDREDTIGLHHWATNGGDEAIDSYARVNGARDHWRDAIDKDHIAWLRTLPTIWRDEARGLVFVHAGIDPRRYPDCPEGVHLWTRSRHFFDPGRWPDRPELEGLVVVHGHTPTRDFAPHANPRRINVDTGACFGGPLTCVVLAPEQRPRYLQAGS